MLENIENNGDTIIAKKKYTPIPDRTVEYKEDKGHPLSPSISLTDDHQIIDLDGYHVTVGDLKEHVIDSHIYRKHIRELIRKAEKGGTRQ